MFKSFAIFLGALFFGTSLFAVDADWRLKKEEDGIKVFTHKVEGSSMEAFKGVATVPFSLDTVIALFEDTPTGKEWMHQCVEFRQLEQASDADRTFYFHQALQWPVADRDIVFRRVRTKDETTGAVRFNFSPATEIFPEQKKIVRMPEFASSWKFTPQGENVVLIEYEVLADPGGKIPKWLANRVAVDLPFYTLQRFREFLGRERV